MSIKEAEAQETPTTGAQQEQTSSLSSEIIEVSWEEAQSVVETRNVFIELESYISSMLLRHEKEKMNLLVRSSELEKRMYAQGQALRESKSLDSELTYELKLPAQAGGKAYFIRKDA